MLSTEISSFSCRYSSMRTSAVRSFMRSMPRQPYSCHKATLTLARFVHSDGEKRVPVSSAEAYAFAGKVGHELHRANMIPPTTGLADPSNLFSILAVLNLETERVCHTAMLINMKRRFPVAEAIYGSTRMSVLPLHGFILREARNDHVVYQFSPALVKELFFDFL